MQYFLQSLLSYSTTRHPQCECLGNTRRLWVILHYVLLCCGMSMFASQAVEDGRLQKFMEEVLSHFPPVGWKSAKGEVQPSTDKICTVHCICWKMILDEICCFLNRP